ncbi:cobalamin biosynthesis protein [Nonomuraea mangrovi]|uniref:Cobalamin biosynthesis protein CobD n=1 Tax=Nonomuraea mangrovi TaxID=2316207 RepID=A0ABW4TDG4_9ACTN
MHISSRSAGLALGVLVDAVVGDPRRGHPVALFGRAAAALEKRLYGDARPHGVAHVAICVGASAGLGLIARRASGALASSRAGAGAALGAEGRRARPGAEGRWAGLGAEGRWAGLGASRAGLGAEGRRAVLGWALEAGLTAAATWAVLGGTTLAREGAHMAEALEADDLAAARRRLPHLCGRDPSALEAPELARATVESLAENTSDAVVAPLFWGAVAGVPGLLAYRAVNTLDAMVGHHSPRYENFGWAAARLDDVANYVPARITGLLAVLAAPDRGRALRVLRRDGHRHPSPNAGRCEAAFAGALDVTLGGTNVYGSRVEHRPEMGDGPKPEVRDIRRAVRLTRTVSLAAAAIAVLVPALWPRRARRSHAPGA